MVGVAVNVTLVPAQMVVPVLALMETAGVNNGFTVMVIALEVTEAGLTHDALLVITHVTI